MADSECWEWEVLGGEGERPDQRGYYRNVGADQMRNRKRAIKMMLRPVIRMTWQVEVPFTEIGKLPGGPD